MKTLIALMALAAASAAAQGPLPHGVALEPAAAAVPAARWERADLVVEVTVQDGARIGAERFPAALHYVVGVVAMPALLLAPEAALGWPFYIVLAAPAQGLFNARTARLAQAFGASPLPAAVVGSLRAQWPFPVATDLRRVRMAVAGYGLATRSGRPLELFGANEDLCLGAEAVLTIEAADGARREAALAVGGSTPSPEAPPPLCAPLGRWAEHDALLLRQSIAELAELLAALALQQLQAGP